MTSKERVLAAADHRVGDRTPITFDAESEIYAALHEHFGTATKEALFDALGCDTWMILPGNFGSLEEDADRDEKRSIWARRLTARAKEGSAIRRRRRSLKSRRPV